MNTNERKPLRRDYVQREYDRPLLVSDRDLYPYTITENGMAGENKNRMLRRLRHFYEDLITTGKLRVVEEVELKGNDYDCLLQCTGCKWSIGWHIEEDLEPMKFCPGCGNKIKR